MFPALRTLAICTVISGFAAQAQFPKNFSFSGYNNKLDDFAKDMGGDPDLSLLDPAEEKIKSSGSNLMINGVFNVLMAREVGRYLSSSGDLNYARAFATFDDADDRLTLAYNFTENNLCDKPFYDPVGAVFTLGLKGDIKDNFLTIWNGKGLQRDAGFFFKAAFPVGRRISYYKYSDVGMANYQWKQHYNKQKEVIADFKKEMADLRKDLKLNDAVGMGSTEHGKDLAARYKTKLEEVQRAAADALIEDVLNIPLYTWSRSYWWSFDLYVPVLANAYEVATNSRQASSTEQLAKPTSGSVSFGGFFRSARGWQVQGKLAGRGWQNNSVAAELIETKPFQTVVGRGADSLQTVVETDDVYIGLFETFPSASIALRGVVLAPKLLGISAEIERVLMIGEKGVEATNWKLGIPFILQARKAEDTPITVEVQWREQFGARSVGLSVGIPFGTPVFE